MNLTWPLALVIMAFLALFGWMISLEYKKKDHKEQKKFRDPVFVAITVTLLSLIVLLVVEAFDWLPDGWTKSNLWVFPVVFLAALLWSTKQNTKLKPMKEKKLGGNHRGG